MGFDKYIELCLPLQSWYRNNFIILTILLCLLHLSCKHFSIDRCPLDIIIIIIIINLFIYFMAVLGLRFCARAFSSCGERGPLFIAGLSLSQPLPLWSTGSRRAGSVAVAHGLSCSTACGILPDQGSNPCPLHWQADSQPLRHQGSP